MKILYIYDDEVIRTFVDYRRRDGTYSTAIEQLIASFNAYQIDDEGFLKLEEEE